MNQWFEDPRVEQAEEDGFQAEHLETRGDPGAAGALYRKAADRYAQVAFSVPADHPNTRTELAIAAVACAARGGDFQWAIEIAERMLAEAAALNEYGQTELRKLLAGYSEVIRAREHRSPESGSAAPAGKMEQMSRASARGAFERHVPRAA